MTTTHPTTSLGSLLTAHARDRPDLAATILPRGRRHRSGARGFRITTYAELDRRSNAIAAGLTDIGIGTGVRTALLVPPTGDFFALAFALLKANAVPVLVDPGIGPRHLKRCLGEASPGAFVAVPRAHVARRLLGWCPSARLAVTVGPRMPGGGIALHSVQRRGERLQPFAGPAADPEQVALIAFTSGSTGAPKGVEYRQPHFLAQLDILRTLYDLSPGDVSVATFPPFALLGPALGLTTVVPRMDPTRPADVDPGRIVDAANSFAATVLFGSPALLETVSRWGASSGARMPTLRRVVSAGAPVSRSVQRRTLAMLAADAQVHTPYGATEALPVTSIASGELAGLAEGGICVGRPAPGVELAVIEVTDAPLPHLAPAVRVPDGSIGEIVVRGPNVTEAYVHRPEATMLAKTEWDGRLAHRMGDVGYLDPQGRLWYGGRKVHRVKTPITTMYSVPCEEVFNAHPAVFRSALVGVGPPGQQRPVICVELERGVGASAARLDVISRELLDLGAASATTEEIRTVLYHPGFPVDIRHNAKINREQLAGWAATRLARRRGRLPRWRGAVTRRRP